MANKPTQLSPTHKGRRVETQVMQYLQTHGYVLIQQNFRWRRGEADLICQGPQGALVMIEVRSSTEVSPLLRYSIGPKKLRRLYKTLDVFIMRHPQYRLWERRLEIVWVEAGQIDHWRQPL